MKKILLLVSTCLLYLDCQIKLDSLTSSMKIINTSNGVL